MPVINPHTLRTVSFSLKNIAAVIAAIMVAPPSFIGNMTADGTTLAAEVASWLIISSIIDRIAP